MAGGSTTLTLRVWELLSNPHSLAGRALLASIAYFPAAYRYDPLTDTLEVNCGALTGSWTAFTGSREFDASVRSMLQLLDTLPAAIRERRARCGDGRIQGLVRVQLQRYRDACRLLEAAKEYRLGVDERSRSIDVYLGRGPYVKPSLAPTVVTAIVFLEGVRLYPARQLAVEEGRVRGGYQRRVHLSCETYAAMTIGLAASLVRAAGFGARRYHFLFPLTPVQSLAARLTAYKGSLARLFSGYRVGPEDVPEPGLYLILASLALSPAGVVELMGVEVRGRRGTETLDLLVDLGGARLLPDALGYSQEKAEALAAGILEASRDYRSGGDAAQRARLALEAVEALYSAVWGVGRFEESLYRAARLALEAYARGLYERLALTILDVVGELVKAGRVML